MGKKQRRPDDKSQHGEEDVIFRHFTGARRKNGYLVDAGAADGKRFSNSWTLLNKHGWSGMLIEPHPQFAQQCRDLYADNNKVEVLEVAVFDRRCQQDFYPFSKPPEGQVSTLDLAFKARAEAAHGKKYHPPIKVECWPLGQLLKKQGAPKKIDFMSIDCEGVDMKVVRSMDWAHHHVELVCVETSMRPLKQLITFMQSVGYRQKERTLGNMFFVKRD